MKRLYQTNGFNLLLMAIIIGCFLMTACDINQPSAKQNEKINIEKEVLPNAVTDMDGNSYSAVKIGEQVWMKENLRTTKYADGTPIELGSTTSTTTPYRYYPNDDSTNVYTYGYLYNWKAVMRNSSSSSSNPSGTHGICPTGWHVPSDAEGKQLKDYLGGTDVAGGKMKEAGTFHWCSPNEGADNSSDFSALPAGGYYGNYNHFGTYAAYWSATGYNNDNAYYCYLYHPRARVGFYNNDKNYGYSVRCLRD